MKFLKEFTNLIKLRAVFTNEAPEGTIETNNQITEFLDKKEAVIFLGEKEKFTLESLNALVNKLISLPRDYDLDLDSFVTEKVSAIDFAKELYSKYLFANAKIYSAKTIKDPNENKKTLNIISSESFEKEIKEVEILADAVNFARDLQATPPNICNSEWLAERVKEEVIRDTNLTVKILNKKQIEKFGMNLLLSVNKGSMYEPRVVVVEYNGNPNSSEKTALVGKGITFDSGGYNIKTGRFMLGMKYDMSGAAIVASTLKAISKLKPKANFVAVLSITDNRVNGDANLPDAVWKSMNGKTVEINNTDAEGRLVLADAMTYAIRELKATEIVTVATLTGAILVALGTTFTGAFATQDELWKEVEEAAKIQKELVWRMPLHEDFAKYIKGSSVADLKNTDLTGNGGSISAAMFLKEFSEDLPFVHLDVAGTAETGEKPMGVMVKTLTQLALNKK